MMGDGKRTLTNTQNEREKYLTGIRKIILSEHDEKFGWCCPVQFKWMMAMNSGVEEEN